MPGGQAGNENYTLAIEDGGVTSTLSINGGVILPGRNPVGEDL